MAEKMNMWRLYPLEIGVRWTMNRRFYVVRGCRKILWWYRITFELSSPQEGEF